MLLSLYRLLIAIATPPALLWLGLQALRRPAYRRGWRQRLGYYDEPLPRQGIWLHAASVGEVQASLPLIRALLERHPELPLLVTTVTPTGAERLRQALGERAQHAYLPWDSSAAVRRFLDAAQPRLALIMEMEIWPNLLLGLAERGIPRLLLNARMSERSAGRYRRARGLFERVLQGVTVAAQTQADAERLRSLGVPAGALRVVGNIKYDMVPPPGAEEAGRQLRESLGGAERPLWIAASTHDGEDEQVLRAHGLLRERFPQLGLILVPRHPERFDAVDALCRRQGFSVARRSRDEVDAGVAVYLGDTMGELMLMLAAADVVFVGGSLVPVGGHNLLEPAALGKASISGPQVFNFRQVVDLLQAAEAVEIVDDAEALAEAVARNLSDPVARRAAGERARRVVQENQGALERCLEMIEQRVRSSQ